LHSAGVERIYRDLAVISGSVYPHWKEPGQIGISLPSGGGAFKRADAAIEAGENEASKEDNRRKLGAAGTRERHLAVYVFTTNYRPWCALVDCVPPAKPAHLPSEITDLWLFTETRSTYEYVIWHASASLGWHGRRLLLQAIPHSETAGKSPAPGSAVEAKGCSRQLFSGPRTWQSHFSSSTSCVIQEQS
jgi:hypothetical protein